MTAIVKISSYNILPIIIIIISYLRVAYRDHMEITIRHPIRMIEIMSPPSE